MKTFTKAGLLIAAVAALNGHAFAQWQTTGNTLSGSEVLGSTNAQDLVFITDNNEVMRLHTNGALEQGFGCSATGANSQAMGSATTASGLRGFAVNYQTVASGDNSAAFNYQSIAGGDQSLAANGATTAQSYEQTALGRYNNAFGNATTWVTTDPLFQVGNGTAMVGADALTLLKNGNTTVSGTFFAMSDARLKTNLEPVTSVLGKLDAIQPVYYNFIDNERHPDGRQLGFLAQEIEKQFPELVLRNQSGYLAVAYGNMSAVAIEAIKEQQAIIKSQDERIARLEAAIQKLTGSSASGKLGMLDTSGR